MKTGNNKVSYVALDTNVFISIASVNSEIGPDCKRGGFYSKIRDMKRLAEAGHLKFVITPGVFVEILKQKRNMNPKIRDKEMKFLEEYCQVYTPKDMTEFYNEVYKLAKHYIDSGVMKNEEKRFADAMIMAEASFLGLNLISNNVKDFSYYTEDSVADRSKARRSKDIQRINEKNGYIFHNTDGLKIVPRPYTSDEFLELFRSGLFLGRPNFSKGFERGDI